MIIIASFLSPVFSFLYMFVKVKTLLRVLRVIKFLEKFINCFVLFQHLFHVFQAVFSVFVFVACGADGNKTGCGDKA